MSQPFVEYREVSVRDPLRQGDVIEATRADTSRWQRHLLVITADCDFANAKNQGRVTCVPVLSQEEYLMEFQIPRLRDQIVIKTVRALQGLIVKAGGPAISESRLREWPTEQAPEEISAALALRGSQADDVQKLLSAIKATAELPGELDDAVARLVAAQVEVPNGKKLVNAKRDTADRLKQHFSRPPGDALFLSCVAPNLDSGYFVYLRHLEQVSQPKIAIGPTRSAMDYRRIARLQDRFIHAISQQFGMVFMAIGLPREYEEIRDLYSDLLGEKFQ